MNRTHPVALALFLALWPGGLAAAQGPATAPATRPAAVADLPDDPDAAELVVPIDGRDQTLKIFRTDKGYAIIVQTPHGTEAMTPADFAEMIYRQQQAQRRHWLFTVFNITTWWGVLWVSVGLLGQLMFTFRMILQWLASEKEKKSVVPVGFWWGSLMGGLMLLSYFIWRKDIVGILGQSTGAFIYARNLMLIYRRPVDVSV